MKKTLFLFLTMLSVAGVSRAYDFSAVCSTGQTLYYNITGSTTVEVTCPGSPNRYESYGSYTRPTGSMTIPAGVSYNGSSYTVKTIGDYAFDYCYGLTSVTIPNSVTSIGDYAFHDCYGLTSVTIPNSVTSIGDYAFDYCEGLTSLTIGNSVTSIGDDAFNQCSNLTSVTIPNSVTSIGNEAFYNCYVLTNLTIGNSVTSIGSSAFQACYALTSVTIPNSVISIGNKAFFDCVGMTSLTIGNSVTSIGSSAFMGCEGLTSVTIPNSVTSIGMWAFYLCTGLTSITIPNSVTSIGERTFAGCSSLTSVTIPNTVTSIGVRAFAGCSGLSRVVVPNSVTSIGEEAFNSVGTVAYGGTLEGCPWGGNTCETNVENEDSFFSAVCSTGQTLYYNIIDDSYSAHRVEVCYPAYNWNGYTQPTGNLEIPATVVHNNITYTVHQIGEQAFRYCTGLTSVTISSGYIIKKSAFENCTNLTSVEIPSTIYTIDTTAFRNCSALTSVDIANSTNNTSRHIKMAAFENCTSLTYITIPNRFMEIGEHAFHHCYALTSVTLPVSMYYIRKGAFAYCTGLTRVYYKGNMEDWLKELSFEDSESNPLHYAHHLYLVSPYFNPYEVTSLQIPSTVTSIGQYAFDGFTALTSVTIPTSVTSIGKYAFQGCTGLTSVDIPNSVNNLHKGAFARCSGLTSVFLPNTIININDSLFYGCTNLSNVFIPTSVSYIDFAAFRECTSLTSIIIPASVVRINNEAFWGCTSLNSIQMMCTTAPTLVYGALLGTAPNLAIQIPCGSRASYESAWGTDYYDHYFYTPNRHYSNWGPLTVCDKYTWPANRVTYTETPSEQLKVVMTATSDGCDSIHVLDLTIEYGGHSYSEITSCGPYTWDVNGKTYNQSGLKTYKGTPAVGGCPSRDTLNLTIIKGYGNRETVVNCGPYYWQANDRTYNKSGVKTYKHYGSDGCPIYDTLDLTVVDRWSSHDTVYSCLPYTWQITGKTYNKSGIKTYKQNTPDGCLLYDTLTLVVDPNRSSHEYVTNCGPYTWDVNGKTYSKSGVKTFKYTTNDGCIHRDTLTLTVGYDQSSHVYVTNCGPYTWDVNGKTYNKSGTKTYKGTTPEGCISRDTLTLTVINCDGSNNPDNNAQLSTLNAQLSLYPNPTTGVVKIDAAEVERVEVVDLVGRRVALFENSRTIDLSNLADGTYALRITLPDAVVIKKVVKN